MRLVATAAAGLLAGCGPSRPAAVVFPPLSYRVGPDTPVVRAYPTFVHPGSEVAITARALTAGPGDQCVSVLDADGAPWLESCGPNETRRLTFTPRRPGRHTVVVFLDRGEDADPRYFGSTAWRDTFCVLGSDDPEACG